MQIRDYIEANKERFVDELGSLIRIQSVSAKVENKPQMLECASRWAELLLAAGAQRAEVMQTAGNPVVYGEYRAGEDLPTVLIYAHYDVMPVEPLELWLSDPFEPTIRDGKIYARGADDDKGQGMMQVKGFETALRTGNPPADAVSAYGGRFLKEFSYLCTKEKPLPIRI